MVLTRIPTSKILTQIFKPTVSVDLFIFSDNIQHKWFIQPYLQP